MSTLGWIVVVGLVAVVVYLVTKNRGSGNKPVGTPTPHDDFPTPGD